MKTKEQVYSMVGHDYYPYEYLMSNLRDYHNIGESVEVWEADKVEWRHSDFINVEGFIYDMQANAMDFCEEISEEYLNELTDLQKGDLKNNISKWFGENNIPLKFFGVENEKKIMVVVE